jgi:hypothetical protein
VSSAQTAPFCTAVLNSHSDAFENIVQSGCPETIPWKAMSRNGFACDVAPAATTADDRLTFSEELVRLDPVKSTRNTAHKLYHHAALRTKRQGGGRCSVAALQRGLIQDRERFYFFDKPIDCPHSHPSFFFQERDQEISHNPFRDLGQHRSELDAPVIPPSCKFLLS